MIIGTRPEAIKLAPVVREFQKCRIPTRTLLTGQHDEQQVLPVLETIGVDLGNVIRASYQRTVSVTESLGVLVDEIGSRVAEQSPAFVVVQGDTASTFAGALASFVRQVPLVHVEAGLRTRDLRHPFPEEGFRQAVARWASVHLCPTERARKQLMSEEVPHRNLFVTGNTGLDSLRLLTQAYGAVPVTNQIVFTMHRRESWGAKMLKVLRNIRVAADQHPSVDFVVIAHPNPALAQATSRAFGGAPNVRLLGPQPYTAMVRVLLGSRGLVTDSGGLQEEALALGIPTLVLRQKTERPELLDEGDGQLIGNEGEGISSGLDVILSRDKRTQNAFRSTVLGDGKASQRIVDALMDCDLLAEVFVSETKASSLPASGSPGDSACDRGSTGVDRVGVARIALGEVE